MSPRQHTMMAAYHVGIESQAEAISVAVMRCWDVESSSRGSTLYGQALCGAQSSKGDSKGEVDEHVPLFSSLVAEIPTAAPPSATDTFCCHFSSNNTNPLARLTLAGSCPHQDDEARCSRSHREVLPSPQCRRLPHQQEGHRRGCHHPLEASPQQDCRLHHAPHEAYPEGPRPWYLLQAPGGGA